LLSPAIAAGLAVVMGLDKLTLAVLVVLSATPSAVVTTLFAVEYDTLPELVAMITVFTTVLSFLTVTVLLSLFI
jgi:hypothetical protein